MTIFAIGDVVRLKADAPGRHVWPMTIESVLSYSHTEGLGIACVWFETGAELHRRVFDPLWLEHIEVLV